MTFQNLKLIDPLLKALAEEGYSIPTPIQSQAIPIVLEGNDLLGCAQTGTGKTAAFAIPILQLLSESTRPARRRPIRSLILTPTRELAIQIDESFRNYGRHLPLRCNVIFGGVNAFSQIQALKGGCDILVATPGRLLDLMQQGHIHLEELQVFVLDEADRMLDMGFIHDIRRVLKVLPKVRQSLFFSATMPAEIQKLANTILHQPQKVEVTPVSSTAETIQQYVYFVDRINKNSLLVDLIRDKEMSAALVFTRTKHGADKVARILNKSNLRAEAIHGNKSQNARQNALQNFKNGTTRVLVATDIAARGIDVDNLQHVFNFELPNVPETYVHRIGRTGRAGASGTAYAFCDAEEKPFLKDIEKLTGIKIPVVDDHAYPLMGSSDPAQSPSAAEAANRVFRGEGRNPKVKLEAERKQPPRQATANSEKTVEQKMGWNRWRKKK